MYLPRQSGQCWSVRGKRRKAFFNAGDPLLVTTVWGSEGKEGGDKHQNGKVWAPPGSVFGSLIDHTLERSPAEKD